MVIEEGQPDFQRVRHGILVLTNDTPVLQPLIPLDLKQTVEKKPRAVAYGWNPAVGGKLLEFRCVGRRAGIPRPKRFEGHGILEEIAPSIAAHEIDEPGLSLLAETGGKN